MSPWVAAKCKCRVCSHEHVSVHPVEADDDMLECPKCHAMSAEVTHYIDENSNLVPREDV